MMPQELIYDTLIIGGGIAGLQAAIQLGRSLHKVIVVDHGKGRSTIAKKYRNILGYPQGISGESLRSNGEEQARELGVVFMYGEVTALSQKADHAFVAEVMHGSGNEAVVARTVLVASGIKDPFPTIPGLTQCLGESLFICPDCDGYEIIGKHALVIGSGKYALEMADTLQYFTNRLTVINHTLTPSEAEPFTTTDGQIRVIDEPISEIFHKDGQMQAVQLVSGERISVEKGFLAFPGAKVQSTLLEKFQVDRLENGHVLVNPRTKETSYRNIWAAGDIVAHSQQVTISMGDGSQAAIWIHKRLLEKENECT
ncbi:MAG: NAD(P)/FAD-dependent oxidoreductase [Clostridia bacterium]